MASANRASERGCTAADVRRLADNLVALTDEEAIQFFRELAQSSSATVATPHPSGLTDAIDGLISRYALCSYGQ